MNVFSWIFIFSVTSFLTSANEAMERHELTFDNAKALGFYISINITSHSTLIEVAGPKKSITGCSPSQSGVALHDRQGNSLLIYQTRLNSRDEEPIAFGTFDNASNNMSIWLDYLCSPEEVNKSRRYVISSVSEYIISSQHQEK